MVQGDLSTVLTTLAEGMSSRAHAEFVKRLAGQSARDKKTSND
jgi:hypothetical protein